MNDCPRKIVLEVVIHIHLKSLSPLVRCVVDSLESTFLLNRLLANVTLSLHLEMQVGFLHGNPPIQKKVKGPVRG